MSDFFFLRQFVIPSEAEQANSAYKNYKHHLFPIVEKTVDEIDSILKVPVELKEFYTKIGYGFFYQGNTSAFNRLLDINSFKLINLKEDYYEFDSSLHIYDSLYQQQKLLFYEVSEGHYLAINKEDISGRNAIYYFQTKISDSLEEFLRKLDANPDFINEIEY